MIDVWAGVFTVAMCLLWVGSFLWSFQRRPYYAFALVTGTTYCLFSEVGAIKQGMYYYDKLLQFGGYTPPTFAGFGTIAMYASPFLVHLSCPTQPTLDIPIGVSALEGVVLIAVFRTTNLLGVRYWAKPFLDGFIVVVLDAILDPIVATSFDCTGAQHFKGLSFWVWRLSDQNPGTFWFGIPMMNFVAWFANMFAFAIAIRLVAHYFDVERGGPAAQAPNAIGTGPRIPGSWSDLWKAVIALIVFLILEYVVVMVLKKGLYMSNSQQWQAGYMGAILAVSLIVVLIGWRPLRTDHQPEWAHALPAIVLSVFTLVALAFSNLFGDRPMLWAVWVVTALIGITFSLMPYKGALLRHPPAPPAAGGAA